MIVSLGLALATWVRRLGRAVALSVIAFFLGGMGWVLLVETLFQQFVKARPVGWFENMAGCATAYRRSVRCSGPNDRSKCLWESSSGGAA